MTLVMMTAPNIVIAIIIIIKHGMVSPYVYGHRLPDLSRWYADDHDDACL